MGRQLDDLPILRGLDNLKKKIKITFNSPVTLSFTMICFIATLLGFLSNGRITKIIFMTYHSSLMNPMTYIRFVTHVFGHEGWPHFIGNASYLLLLGPMLEEKHGSKELIEVSYWGGKLHFLCEYWIVWSERSGICVYYSCIVYRIQRG